jgi:hypothetical protein
VYWDFSAKSVEKTGERKVRVKAIIHNADITHNKIFQKCAENYIYMELVPNDGNIYVQLHGKCYSFKDNVKLTDIFESPVEIPLKSLYLCKLYVCDKLIYSRPTEHRL